MARHALERQPIARRAKIIFMVTAMKRFQWIWAVLVCFSVHAGDISAYKIGDTAQEDITATAPFDVVDAEATATLKATKALNVPAIYREYSGVTNAIANQFLA